MRTCFCFGKFRSTGKEDEKRVAICLLGDWNVLTKPVSANPKKAGQNRRKINYWSAVEIVGKSKNS